MDTHTAIKKRRSVKHYDPEHRMSDAEIKELMELVKLTPTSFNMQNCRFVVVTDPELRQDLRAAAWDQAQVTDASIVVLLCGDLRAHAKDASRYWANAPQEVQDTLVPMIGGFYEGKDQLQRDEAMRSSGLAGQTLMLAAKAMGYDTCPMVGFDPVKAAELINLPEDHVVSFMIVVGKPAKPARERPTQLPYDEVVIRDRFPE